MTVGRSVLALAGIASMAARQISTITMAANRLHTCFITALSFLYHPAETPGD